MFSEGRKQWVRVCFMFTVIWLLLTVAVALGFIVCALASFLLAFLPVELGKRDDDSSERPWKKS